LEFATFWQFSVTVGGRVNPSTYYWKVLTQSITIKKGLWEHVVTNYVGKWVGTQFLKRTIQGLFFFLSKFCFLPSSCYHCPICYSFQGRFKILNWCNNHLDLGINVEKTEFKNRQNTKNNNTTQKTKIMSNKDLTKNWWWV
jgi:hypothetical protein